MAARLLWCVMVVAAAVASAQTVNVATTDVSRGVTLLPDSLAYAEESTALSYNPAGLGHVGLWNAVYVHERSSTRNLIANGIFAATSVGDVAGFGLGLQWWLPTIGGTRTKFTVAGALGPEAFSAGFAANWFYAPGLDGLLGLDVGVQSRPLRWLSVGAISRNVNTPSRGALTLGREWGLGVGLRPFGERVTLGIDWYFPEALPIGQSRMQYTAQATLIQGLRVSGGVSHGLSGGAALAFQVGLGVDLEQVGYTQGFATANGQFDFQFMGRASGPKYASIVPAKKLAVIELDGIGSEGGSTLGALLGIATEDRYVAFLRFLDRASRDPDLAGVLLKIEGASLGLARADEVRAALERLRASGKKVYGYILNAGDAEYLMASACDALFAASEAMLIVDGLRSTVTFFGGAAEKLGVTVDVARVGAYKSFPDQFTRTSVSDEQREALNAYLDAAEDLLARRVTSRRPLTLVEWKAGLDEGLKPTRRAKELKQVDDVFTPQQLDAFLKQALPNATVTATYRPFSARDTRWGSRRQIAVVPVLGNITGGKNQSSPLGGAAGAESFITALQQAVRDDDVKAIVLRVDSGGGDGMASDMMYRAVLEAKKQKPVIASMGDAAASGGYYVAMGADEIWASPTTLTGSIGVFYAKPSVKQLANTWGVTQESFSRGKLAGIADFFDPWTDDQRVAAQRWVDDFYDTFITEVAASRKMTKEAVDQVARGRVWSGRDARDRGLVDHLGGLMDAVQAAKTKAGLAADDDDFQLTIAQAPGTLLGSLLGVAAPQALLDAKVPDPSPLPPALKRLVADLGPDGWLFGPPAVQARLEFQVDLR